MFCSAGCILIYITIMLSPKEDAQRRQLANKQLPKNPKLASMANIANRSPLNKYENKEPAAINSSSKKPSFEYKDKNSNKITGPVSPRDYAGPSEGENSLKRAGSSPGDYSIKGFVPQRREYNALNVLPEWRDDLGNNQNGERNYYSLRHTHQNVSLETARSITLPNGDKYEGQFFGNLYQGKGTYIFKAQNFKYEGDFHQGKQHGLGILTNLATKEVVYQGDWEYGMKHGEGRYTYDQDQYYNGDWINDQKHGIGVYHFGGAFYNGSWVKNKREGKGSLKLENGTEFKGTFQNNQFVKGFVRYPNGDEYSGQMKNNRRTGDDGSYIEASTKNRYKGTWFNDRKNGRGTITYENGDELSGTFMDGQLNEQYVVMYKWRDGTVFNGWFRLNQPNKGTVSRSNGQKWEI